MDSVELISLAVAGALILLVIVVVVFRPSLGGKRSGYIDPGGDSGAGGD
jgi:hypothetical protein